MVPPETQDFQFRRGDQLLFAAALSVPTLCMRVAAAAACGTVAAAATVFFLFNEGPNTEEYNNSKDRNHNYITETHKSEPPFRK